MTNEEHLRRLTPDTHAAVTLLLRRARQAGYPATITSGRRDCMQQNALFAQGRTAEGEIVTFARGCNSWHVHGRAVDVDLHTPHRQPYEQLGLWWEGLGGGWGGRFSDLDDVSHFEWHPGIRIDEVCPDPSDCRTIRAAPLVFPKREPESVGDVVFLGLLGVVGWIGSRLVRRGRRG